MTQLKTEQAAFAEAAKKIEPNKSPIEVFKQNTERASDTGQIDPGHLPSTWTRSASTSF